MARPAQGTGLKWLEGIRATAAARTRQVTPGPAPAAARSTPGLRTNDPRLARRAGPAPAAQKRIAPQTPDQRQTPRIPAARHKAANARQAPAGPPPARSNRTRPPPSSKHWRNNRPTRLRILMLSIALRPPLRLQMLQPQRTANPKLLVRGSRTARQAPSPSFRNRLPRLWQQTRHGPCRHRHPLRGSRTLLASRPIPPMIQPAR
jgi:hypothetical protein